jgi:serine/threonine protein kinase
MKKEKATTKVDMWALGVIMFYLITNKHPFDRDGKDINTISAIEDP